VSFSNVHVNISLPVKQNEIHDNEHAVIIVQTAYSLRQSSKRQIYEKQYLCQNRILSLTETTYSSIELESRRTVEHLTIGRHPLSCVRRQLTRLMASIVEKPATRQVVGFRAQSTTHCSRRITHFDCLEVVRNHSNVFVKHVLVATFCHNTVALSTFCGAILIIPRDTYMCHILIIYLSYMCHVFPHIWIIAYMSRICVAGNYGDCAHFATRFPVCCSFLQPSL